MFPSTTKICSHCNNLFTPSRSCQKRQCYCTRPECKKASAQSSQKKWLNKPENQNYFRGNEHVERVRQWRAEHPGYWRRNRRIALQEIVPPQAIEIIEESSLAKEASKCTLQEIEDNQGLIIIGLISILTGSTLQDELAITSSKLIQAAHEMLSGGSNEQNISNKTRANPAHPPTVQLVRPAPSA